MVLKGSEKYIEIETLRRTMDIEGVPVCVRCFLVTEPKMHYELVLTSLGEHAVVDVAIDRESELREFIDTSALSFATAIMLRRGLFF